jgi:hypothetical protein
VVSGTQTIIRFLDRVSIQDKPQMFVKYLIRCLTSCLRQDQGIISVLQNNEFLEKMIEIVRVISDEEIVANACKCLRICLRDDQNLDVVVKKRKDIANILIETINAHAYSDAICQEVLSALRSFTRKTEYVILIFLENVKVVIEVAKQSKNEK